MIGHQLRTHLEVFYGLGVALVIVILLTPAVGGMARLQQLTGGQLLASPNAARVFATGVPGAGDPQVGMHPPFPAARVDGILKDLSTGPLRCSMICMEAYCSA